MLYRQPVVLFLEVLHLQVLQVLLVFDQVFVQVVFLVFLVVNLVV
jgi:hypothetical protein